MTCLACGFDNPEDARFCGRCGAALGVACPSCGATVRPELAYCTSCGTELALREERKVLTVLFSDLVGFTGRAEQLDPEEVRRVLTPYYARLRSELERFGGTVEKFIGDAVVALFGAPVAHEDDAERGVRAALAIRAAVAELNEAELGFDLHVRVAVTTGEAVVALGARPTEGEGMAAGDVLNTASRLQAAAPVDGILVDAATHRATAAVIEYREAEQFEVKGKEQPILAWEPLFAHAPVELEASEGTRGPFVGRRRELALLLDLVARSRAGRVVQLATLVGAPGIGKSRLVYELFNAVQGDPEPASWQLGRSLPYGEGVTFWALGEMVKGEAEILETDEADEAGAKLRDSIERVIDDRAEVGWVEGHLRALVGLGGEGELGRDRRSEAFAAWRRYLEALAARNPLVLVFEDLHWADDGLLDFIDHLVEWASGVPLLVVGTARSELLERRSGWTESRQNAVTVPLSPLSDEETVTLVGALLEDALLTARAESALLARAAGNPLYAGEYARMLIDRGFAGHDGATAATSEELPLPESIQGIIAARLDALPAGEKALLQDAAVVGRSFWAGALTSLAGLPRWKVEELLLVLERKEFIRRERRSSVGRETQYAFWHILIRDVAYGQIPRGQRAEKHRLAAAWVESLNVERTEDRADMLAHHYLSALEFTRASGKDTAALEARARTALREAGDRAAGLNVFGVAVRFYRGALDLWPADDPAWPQILFRYAKARFHAEAAGAEVLSEAREALLAAGDLETAAEAIVMLGELLWIQGQTDAAFREFEHAAALLEKSPSSRAKAYVLSSLSRFRMIADRNEEAIQVGFEALQMAEELGLEELRAHALNNIGIARAGIGDPGGVVDLEKSIAIAVELNSLESVRGYVNLGTTLAELGDLERAFDLYEQGRRAAEGFGDPERIRWFESERVHELYWRGQWDDAIRRSDELIAEADPGSLHVLHDCRLVRGAIRLARDDAQGALEDSAWALDFARGADYPEALFPALAFRARVLEAVGRRDEAGKLAETLLALWRDSGPAAASYWAADLSFVLAPLGLGDALVVAAGAVRAQTRWLDAAIAFVSGETLRAAGIYADVGARPEEALALLHAGAATEKPGRDNKVEAGFARALAFHRKVGATAYVRDAEAFAVTEVTRGSSPD
jgi:class 3 adenylate cyclase/tetratricopeptide (TPR) repeat protein